MPADNLPLVESREFVRNIDNVLKLLQPTQVYLTPTVSAVEAENTWPPDRNMVVWKDVAGAWHFKIQLLGEQHQGKFDTSIDDDQRVVDCLNALEINPEASEEISELLGPDLLTRIARPYLSLSYSQQNQIIVPLDLSAVWPLDSDGPVDAKIQTCLALLRGEQGDDFSIYLTLTRINQLVGGRIAEFCVTNPNVTSGDVLRFIQFLLRASVRALGHDEPVVLPLPPVGGEIRFRDVPRAAHAQAFRFRARISAEMQTAIDSFEAAFNALETSVPHLSDDDRQCLAQSLAALRAAKTTWFDSNKDMNHLLSFRRATDAVLRADYIQRLYTHQRYPGLGMFSDYVASPETPALQQLRLSLRELRDFSEVRVISVDYRMSHKYILLLFLGLGLALGPVASLIAISLYFAKELTTFIYMTCLRSWYYSEFSFDLWNACIEAYREFFTEDLLLALGAEVALSACYGLLVGGFSAAVGMLVTGGAFFLGASLLFSTFTIIMVGTVLAGIAGYQAVNQWWNETSPSDAPIFEANLDVDSDFPEGTGLTPT